jgi:hypothetical protein
MTNKIIKQIISLILLTSSISCKTKSNGGAIPVFIDEYSFTSDKRFFELTTELSGTIIKYQKAYDCKDSVLYNSTSIIKLINNDTITVYSPCLRDSFNIGDKVIIKQIKYEKNKVGCRDIEVPFPKDSKYYGYYQCISCRYKNTTGMVHLSTH